MKKVLIILIIICVVLTAAVTIINNSKKTTDAGGNAADYFGTAVDIACAAAEDIFGGKLYTVDDTYCLGDSCWIVVFRDRSIHDLDHMYFIFVDEETGAVLSAVRASEAEGSLHE